MPNFYTHTHRVKTRSAESEREDELLFIIVLRKRRETKTKYGNKYLLNWDIRNDFCDVDRANFFFNLTQY